MSTLSIAPAASNRATPLTLGGVLAGGMLAVDPGGWNVFGPGKWLVLTAGTWAALCLALRTGMEAHRGSVLGWGAFLGWAAVTSVLALDPLSAWLGTPDRRLGVVAIATFAAAFLAGQSVADATGRRVLSRAAVVALLGMTAYGAAEAAGWPPVELTTTTSRLGSTLGSPAYLGAALCLLVPIATGAAADRREDFLWRAAAWTAAGGGAFLLVGSGTRAAMVGLVVASLFTASLWWPAIQRRPQVTAGFLVAGLAAVLLVPHAGRLVQPEVEGRLAEWRTAVSVLASHPLTGTGLEGYRVAFPQHVGAEYVQTYGRTTVTDRAHSGPLDVGVTTGLAGMVAWLVAAGWLMWRAGLALRPDDSTLTGMSAGLVALLAQELLLFPTLEVGVAGWLVAGVVVAAFPPRRSITLRSPTLAGAAAMVAILAVGAGAADVAADHLAASARATGDVESADRAGDLRPDSFRYPLLAADLSLRLDRVEAASVRMERALDLSPDDPALRVAGARVLAALVANGARSPQDAADGIAALVDEDPHHPELRLLQGDVLAEAGAVAPAEQAWLAAAHLAPRQAEPHLRLSSLYASLGEEKLARDALDQARQSQPEHPGIARMEEELDGT